MLPLNVNPPKREGYFTYSISPKQNLPDQIEISNTAWIRFDYNPWLQAPEEGPVIRTAKTFIRGDVNADTKITLVDVIHLANYVLKGGPPPVPLQSGDMNCDGKYDLVDVIKLARYVLFGEPFLC